MAVSFIGGGNRSTWRKPLTCSKSQTKLYHIKLYQVHLAMSGIRTHNFAWIKGIWQKHIYIWELKKIVIYLLSIIANIRKFILNYYTFTVWVFLLYKLTVIDLIPVISPEVNYFPICNFARSYFPVFFKSLKLLKVSVVMAVEFV